MIRPEEWEELPRNVQRLYEKLEDDIIADMARRIVKTDMATDTAQWQLIRLQAGSAERDYIIRLLSEKSGKSEEEIVNLFNEAALKAYNSDRDIYKKAGYKTIPLSENIQLQRIINAGLRKTNELFENLTNTTANTASRQFENALDEAYMKVTSGAFDYKTSIREAVRDLSAGGIESIAYPSGHADRLDVAVRRAVLTGVSQTTGKMQEALADQMGCDLVEVTAHAGARPEHAQWQGKVYSRSGKSKKYPDFKLSTGYGTGPGLKGWNCRHDFFPFFEDMPRAYSEGELKTLEGKEVEFGGKKMTEYEASQKQRAYERRIRATKRELVGYDAGIKAASDEGVREELKAAFDRKSVILKKQEAALKDFCRQTGRTRDTFREQANGFGRSVSQKAVWANKHTIEVKTQNTQYFEYLSQLRHGEVKLKEHQQLILDRLPEPGMFVRVKKKEVSLDDLAALSAKQKCEFALFTKGKNSIVLRGNYSSCNIGATLAEEVIDNKWEWVGHSHPTVTELKASEADIIALSHFPWQKKSSIIDLKGETKTFTADWQEWLNDLLGVH